MLLIFCRSQNCWVSFVLIFRATLIRQNWHFLENLTKVKIKILFSKKLVTRKLLPWSFIIMKRRIKFTKRDINIKVEPDSSQFISTNTISAPLVTSSPFRADQNTSSNDSLPRCDPMTSSSRSTSSGMLILWNSKISGFH